MPCPGIIVFDDFSLCDPAESFIGVIPTQWVIAIAFHPRPVSFVNILEGSSIVFRRQSPQPLGCEINCWIQLTPVLRMSLGAGFGFDKSAHFLQALISRDCPVQGPRQLCLNDGLGPITVLPAFGKGFCERQDDLPAGKSEGFIRALGKVVAGDNELHERTEDER